MASCLLNISCEELSKFIINQEDDNYQHIEKVMRLFGKKPIIPAFFSISKIGIKQVSDDLKRNEYFNIEGTFNNIIYPDQEIVFRNSYSGNRIKFSWKCPSCYLKSLKNNDDVTISFSHGEKYVASKRKMPYSRFLRVSEDKLDQFANIIGEPYKNDLTNAFYIAASTTFIIIQSFKNPRNKFEYSVNSLKSIDNSTPFFRYINIDIKNHVKIIPGKIVYEFDGAVSGKAVSYVFRAMIKNEEILNGQFKVYFYTQKMVLRFIENCSV